MKVYIGEVESISKHIPYKFVYESSPSNLGFKNNCNKLNKQ
jgi:hypothetical protein